MTKSQILDMHAHLLRANFQQFAAATSYADPNSEVVNYLCNAEIHAFNNLTNFYAEHTELFNKHESELIDAALTIYDNAGETISDEEAHSLTNIQYELYEYYNDLIDENGYFKED